MVIDLSSMQIIGMRDKKEHQSESVHTAPEEGSVLVVVGEGDVDETLVDVVEQDDDEAAACKINQFLDSQLSQYPATLQC